MDERRQLEEAIAAQDGLRGVIADDVIDTTIGTLRARLDAIDGAPAGERRRRQVTVLFADVSGFTTASEEMDAEDLADAVNALWHELDAAITQFNGRVDKHIGDAVMGLWGTGEAAEDDPEQAIRAALAMHDAVEVLSNTSTVGTSPFRIRIGINTGPVLMAQVGSMGEYTAMGDTVNVAARLEQAAPVGGILVNHETYRHVRGVFAVEAQPPLDVKGKAEPLRTYIVTAVRPRAFRLASRGVEGVETRMVGREEELQTLRDLIQKSIDDIGLQVAAVVGEAGIGKSRLLYEYEDWLRAQPTEVRLFKGRADRQHQGVPYSLTRDVINFRFEIGDDDPPAVALAKLKEGVHRFVGSGTDVEAELIGHLIGLDVASGGAIAGIIEDAKQLRDRAFQAIVQLFKAAANEMPCVVLLEDLHWADNATLQLLDHVADACAQSRMVIVELMRPSLFERQPDWGHAVDNITRIDLARLTDEQSGLLVDEVLQKVGDVPTEIRDKIVASVDGNPFYLEELIKVLIEDGVIVTGDDEWSTELDRLSELQVPATLTGVLQARLDRLPYRERDELERASIVGRIFWDAAIPPRETIDGAGDGEAVVAREVLAALGVKELIRPNDAPDFAGTTEYFFKHAILHDVTYEGVLKSSRRTYHAWVAHWLAGRPEVSAHPAMIAQHYELAGLPDEAAHWYGSAADRARARYANDDAIRYYGLALAGSDVGASDRIALSRGLGQVLMLQARYEEALAATASMLKEAQAASDTEGQARALQTASAVHTRLGHNREALQAAEQAQELLREHGSDSAAELADVMTRTGWAHLRLGRLEVAREQAREALRVSQGAQNTRSLRSSYNLLGAVHAASGDYEDAAEDFERSLQASQDLGDRLGEGRALLNMGEVARLRGDFERAETMSQKALVLQKELGDRDQQALTMSNLGAAYVGMHDYEHAIAELNAAGLEFTEVGAAEHISETYRLLAEAHLGLGEGSAAFDEATKALAHAEAGESPDHLGHAWRVLAMISQDHGAPVEVISEGTAGLYDSDECFLKSLTLFDEADMERDRSLAMWDWASCKFANGDSMRGEALWQEARDNLSKLGLTLFVSHMDAERPVASS